MADLEPEVKRDFMVKRSLMKGILKSENYKSRWFVLTINYLRYCDGTLQVSNNQLLAILWWYLTGIEVSDNQLLALLWWYLIGSVRVRTLELGGSAGAYGERVQREPITEVWGRAPSGVQGQSPWSGGQGTKFPWSWRHFTNWDTHFLTNFSCFMTRMALWNQ